LEKGRHNQHEQAPEPARHKPAPKPPRLLGRKYEITTEFKYYDGKKVYRIRALRDFDEVKAGDLGGYVDGYHNLSQEGHCWISQGAVVHERGYVSGNAWALDKTVVRNNAELKDKACIFDNVVLHQNVVIKGTVQLYGTVVIGGSLMLNGDLRIGTNDELTEYLQSRRKHERNTAAKDAPAT